MNDAAHEIVLDPLFLGINCLLGRTAVASAVWLFCTACVPWR